MTVFLLWHMRPLGPDETHEEGESDDKLCGVFSTEEQATAARQQLMTVEGFVDYPEHFHVDEYEVDQVQWDTGFVSSGPNDA